MKASLERMFGARELVCCTSAMTDFRTILGTLGGPGERERGESLISRIQVVPDQTSLKTEQLATSGNISLERVSGLVMSRLQNTCSPSIQTPYIQVCKSCVNMYCVAIFFKAFLTEFFLCNVVLIVCS